MNTSKSFGELYRLAQLYNVQTAYYDVNHRRKQVSAEALLGALKALGAPVASMNDILSALRERRQSLRRRMMEPVTVACNGERPVIKVCFPPELADASITCRLELESGELSTWKWPASALPVLESVDVEGKNYIIKKITMPESLPWGYHKLVIEVKGYSCETLIISAPRKTYSPSGDGEGRMWGAFLPLYALQSQDSWGCGDYTSLGALAERVAGAGGNIVATLPLLPVFLDNPFDPSPYAPVSRLLWNEFYVDITKVPEFSVCRSAQALVQSDSFRMAIKELRGKSMVDYRTLMSLKRRVMEDLCRCLFSSNSVRLEEFNRFIQENPLIEKYAGFRAVMEKRHAPWSAWPQRLRDGVLKEGDYDEATRNYHMYAQWLAHQQVQQLSENSRGKGVKMYFDLPLGVHADGYDVWQQRGIFAANAMVGAPADAVFTNGQNWGFPPLHPEKIREQGYRYIVDYLHHHLRYADMLRIDHVMGLHRLFWIPQGFDAGDGVYVRYRTDELYAILAVESHRHRSIIVGEDLGIVPSYVRPTMARHGLHRMYVLYYELADKASETLGHIPGNAVVSLNTHDMTPFASFWQGADIEERMGLGLLDEKGALKERKTRRAIKDALMAYLRNKKFLQRIDSGTRAVLKACLAYLSASRARIVLVNLEDLWLETRSQNVPGIGDKFPSWQRKARYGLEEFFHIKEVSDTLQEIDRLRKQETGKER
jgi:4-alpha-glucanotransferase